MLRYPNAVWLAGPLAKRGYPGRGVSHLKTGIVLHSAEGPAGVLLDLIANGPLSWHFSVMKDGVVYQHYDYDDVCWHAGNRKANEELIGCEHEGKAGEPLTPAQLAASVLLTRWLLSELALEPLRGATLHEHNEVVGWITPNAGPTQCPSGRIPWERYTQEDDMTLAELEARIAALEQWREELAPKIDADWAWREEHKNAHRSQPVPPGGPLPFSPVSDIIHNDFDSDPNT